MAGLTIRSIDGVGRIDAAAWDLCAGGDHPFTLHAFLHALEQSGSASAQSGWQPSHLLVEDETGRLLAAAPLYVKSHSYGEYVFDWGWAEAWQRSGRDYYPKLQSAVPFTPVGGRRLLVGPGEDAAALRKLLGGAMRGMVERHRLSSAHVTFLTAEEARALAAEGWLLRIGEQFHWQNPGYGSFDDFLTALASRKRKAIRKEREKARQLGVGLHCLTGAEVKAEHWDAFFRFYLSTSDRKWGQAYLNREFFECLTGPIAERVVLMLAEQDGQWVAGALNFRGADTLYGRNWGALGDFRYLHFELCYYQAIEFAIEHRLKTVEAGAQGEHKISRGYLPVPTYSVHWIREAPFRDAVADFLRRERAAIEHQIALQAEESPFRQTGEEEGGA
jgi:predicted N-acyltransferase